MTRKDYVLIAAALAAAKADIRAKEPATDVDTLIDGVDYAVGWLANRLAQDNSRFDAERFLTAVGA
jgi:hypothetical protein